MFLRKPSGVGISLHAGQIEVAHTQGRGKKALKQMRVERIPFLPDEYENGRIHHVNQFAGKVNQVFENLGLPRRKVTIALPSSVTFLRTLRMPRMKKHKLREVIQFQIGKEIHLPFANPVFDFDFLPPSLDVAKEGGDDDSRHGQPGSREDEVPVLLVAAPGEVVNGLRHAFEQANVELGVMEVKGLSILRALKAMGRKPAGNLVIMEFGMDRIEAHFYQTGALVFSRTLELVPERYIASAAAAEPGLPADGTKPQKDRTDETPHTNAWMLLEKLGLEDRFENMVLELSYQVERFMNFFQHTFHQANEQPVRNLWLTGQVPFPERLLKSMSERLGMINIQLVHLQGFSPRTSASRTGDLGEEVPSSLSAAGAALKGVVKDGD